MLIPSTSGLEVFCAELKRVFGLNFGSSGSKFKVSGFSLGYPSIVGGWMCKTYMKIQKSLKIESPLELGTENLEELKRRIITEGITHIIIAEGITDIPDRAFFYILANPVDNETSDTNVSGTTFNSTFKEDFFGAKLDFYITDDIHLEYTYFNDDSAGETLSYRDGDQIGTSYDNVGGDNEIWKLSACLLYTSPSPRDS